MEIDDEPAVGKDLPVFSAELEAMVRKEKKKARQDAEMEVSDDGDEDFEDVAEDDDHPSHFSESSEEKEDYTIRKTDSLIVAASAESDHSSLEVYLYDHENQDLYVHHEIILSAYPICLEWLSQWQNQKTNHVIVGTFLPEIEIWDLDSETVEPTAVLGSVLKSEKMKQGGQKYVKKFHKGEDVGTHTEAVLCLSLNPHQREYLASGSEDSTVRIWDLDDLQCK
jgi:periodic tryptophan protein 1